MLYKTCLALLCASTGAFVARTPLPMAGASVPAASRLNVAQQAIAAKPMLPRVAGIHAGLDPDTISSPQEQVCIEDEAVEECTLASWDAGSITVPMDMVKTAKLGVCMFAWFFLNVMYNITNKKCQNAFPMPWTMTVVSLFVGVPYILLLWASGIRKAPKLNPGWWKTLMPIGAAHALGHAGAVIALGAGAVSFAQTVKAAEPVFTCVLSYFVLGTVFKWPVYASLIPIVGGVSLASLKELSFTWKALYASAAASALPRSRYPAPPVPPFRTRLARVTCLWSPWPPPRFPHVSLPRPPANPARPVLDKFGGQVWLNLPLRVPNRCFLVTLSAGSAP
jgi:hypothetical protein